jgi:bacillithiol system protein YtxJ
MAKQRVEKFEDSSFDFYYLDLIQHRNLSNLIAEKFDVHHQSPQILIIKNGDCVFDESHGGINIQDLLEFKN